MIKKGFLSFVFMFCLFGLSGQQIQWSTFSDSLNQFSSPRVAHLNNDSVLDIIVGGGVAEESRLNAIQAFDGKDGQVLWSVNARDEVFGSAIFQDISGDGIDDVFIGGRSAIFKAINGSTGQLIWEFWPSSNGLNPKDSGQLQFYSAQWLPDQNSDGYSDLLVSNGGDPDALPWDTNRLPGHLMILDALTGQILSRAVVPDSQETYCSPIVADLANDGDLEIIYGTGGETINGHLYVSKLQDLINEDLSNAYVLNNGGGEGFIAPVSLGDLNGNTTLDIVSISYNGQYRVYDGSGYWLMHSHDFIGFETSAAPVLGYFTGNIIPDVVLSLFEGSQTMYTDYKQVMIDGYTGVVTAIDSFGSMQFSSCIAADLNGDAYDELLISVVQSNGGVMSHELMARDYLNDSSYLLHTSNGQNLGSTALINDLDYNDSLDIVFAVGIDSLNPMGAKGYFLNRIELDASIGPQGIAWANYLGTESNGQYHFNGKVCDTIPLATFSVEQISCNGASDGKMSFTVIGGQAPYTYQFSNNVIDSLADGLEPNFYWARIMDANGCKEDHFANIQDPHVIHKFQQNVSCEGGSDGVADITTSGCTCQFSTCTFQWSNGVNGHSNNNLAAGTYVITVTTQTGCVIIDSVTLSEGPTLIDSTNQFNPVCKGDSNGIIVLYPNMQVGNNNSYIWSHGANVGNAALNLAVDSYQVTVSNTICVDSFNFVLQEPDTFIAEAYGEGPICAEDSNGIIQISTYYTMAPYSVTYWSIDSNGSIDTTYSDFMPGNATYLVIDSNKIGGQHGIVLTNQHGCETDTMWLDLAIPDTLNLSLGSSPESSVGAQDGLAYAQGSGGVPPYQYNWNDNALQTTDTAYNLDSGTYTMTLIDSVGCIKKDSIQVSALTFIEALNQAVRFYPNPSNGILNIDGIINSEPYLVRIFDLGGKCVFESNLITQNLNLQALSYGMYKVIIQSDDKAYSFKWLKY
tara:strand:+ start:2416 stop:5322 length:2907 start_codon:yes stop_codon:yes gene_type:complete